MTILETISTPFRKPLTEDEFRYDKNSHTDTNEYSLEEIEALLAAQTTGNHIDNYSSLESVHGEIEAALGEPSDELKRKFAYIAIKQFGGVGSGANRLHEAYEQAQAEGTTLDEALKSLSDPRYEFLYDITQHHR